jgi:hypothetical protein
VGQENIREGVTVRLDPPPSVSFWQIMSSHCGRGNDNKLAAGVVLLFVFGHPLPKLGVGH